MGFFGHGRNLSVSKALHKYRIIKKVVDSSLALG